MCIIHVDITVRPVSMATNLDHVKNKTSLDREKYECIMKEY